MFSFLRLANAWYMELNLLRLLLWYPGPVCSCGVAIISDQNLCQMIVLSLCMCVCVFVCCHHVRSVFGFVLNDSFKFKKMRTNGKQLEMHSQQPTGKFCAIPFVLVIGSQSSSIRGTFGVTVSYCGWLMGIWLEKRWIFGLPRDDVYYGVSNLAPSSFIHKCNENFYFLGRQTLHKT